MRIQRLELFGFKSFPDRTSFEFGSGISGVVGPNGSGKSNVVDALRWVIGEQSVRSLRGKDMTDIIFAGSAARSPVGFAEVALTLSSAGSEPFPGDLARFEEVEVGRRLYRDGNSEYLLNRVKCRRRDIVDLFMDTGVGSNLYSFIAQGQVDRIISQSPNERRSLIDEAAGISRYKVRRDEALVRLAATATQLDRASDVADEMGRRLRSLEKQVLEAGRFRRVRAQLRQREIALGVVKYAALSGDRRALRERFRIVQQDAGAHRRSVDRLEAELRTRQAELDSVAEAVSTWRDQAAELEAQRREAEGAKILHQRRHHELIEGAKRSMSRATEVAERATEATSAAQALQEQLTTLAEELEALNTGGSDVEEASAALATASARVARLAEEAARVDAERTSLEEQLGAIEEVPEPTAPAGGPLDRSALEERITARTEADGRVSAAEQALKTVREEARAARDRIEAARQAYKQALSTWERQRSARESALQQRERWMRATASKLVQDRRKIRERAEQELEGRARTWNAAIRAERDRREARVRDEARQVRATRRGWGLDFSDTQQARADLDRTQAARIEADRELVACRERLARARGRRVALEAEFDELERQRREGLPDGWAERATLGDTLDADDPRRLARPELLGLPVLTGADLGVPRGRGIWPVENRWVLTDTVAEALEVLHDRGPPVATRDGALRVDADGQVQLGATPQRWSLVRDQLQEAVSSEEEAATEARALAAHQQKTLAAEVEAKRAHAQAEAAAEARVEKEAVRRQQLLSTDIQSWLEAAEAGALQARSGLKLAEAGEGLLAAAWLRSAPADLPARPTWSEPELDTSATTVAEAALDQARREARQAAEAVAMEQAKVADLERRIAVEQAQYQAQLAARQAAISRAATLTARLEALVEVEGREEADAALAFCRSRHQERVETREQTRLAALELREARARVQAEREGLLRSVERAELDRETALEEASVAQQQAEEALAAMEASQELASRQAVQRAEVLERLERDRVRLQKLKEEAKALRENLASTRDAFTRGEAEEKELGQKVEQLQLDIESLRKSLGDRYQVSLPGLLDRLQLRRSITLEPEESVAVKLEVGDIQLEPVEELTFGVSFLDDEDRVVRMVEEVDKLRATLAKVGDVNLAAEEEYRDLHTRYSELDAQRADLEASVISIRAAIAKMNRTCRTLFRDAYDRVNEAFQLSYPKLVGGGDARLALTDDEDLLETGVDIFVRPPGKRLQNLTLLSGGEKAMTAIALLLALFKVRPSPFCVLDEVDAPLDEANGHRFNEMVREMSAQSQFIVITHNRKTMECADVLYGVTMADPGVSKLVSVALS